MKRGVDSEVRAFKEALKRGVGRCVLQLRTDEGRRKFRPLVLWAMAARRMLTDDLLRECLYDCNEDTRRYAARLLKRRKARRGI